MKYFLNKQNRTIIIISVLVFLFFNFIGGIVVHTAGQTALETFLSYLAYAAWGLVFGVLVIFVDWMMGRRKK